MTTCKNDKSLDLIIHACPSLGASNSISYIIAAVGAPFHLSLNPQPSKEACFCLEFELMYTGEPVLTAGMQVVNPGA